MLQMDTLQNLKPDPLFGHEFWHEASASLLVGLWVKPMAHGAVGYEGGL
jgi:hypothetical protein